MQPLFVQAMSQQCIDPMVGKILAGWRYDISELAPEMRGDYESHFVTCEHCRGRQRLNRIIDVGLIALASVSGGMFLLAFGVIRHFGLRHAFWLEIAALTGFALSALIRLPGLLDAASGNDSAGNLAGRRRRHPRPGDRVGRGERRSATRA